MTGCPHTSFQKGKRVRVVLRDGTAFAGKFVERRSRHVVIDRGGWNHMITTRFIRSMTIYRGDSREETPLGLADW